ncbi:protein LURP-one-related 12-like [Cynara cardunculus var. scolymus]|uniref:protein LURP-one-related 12-like n=1 Tax=Cynara cardunculus var. scolymus TaxID=59895 RepID=UPI000D63071B|nr:protein LURP-one-related 12-like [Cynara cardunculus var. scolymus]
MKGGGVIVEERFVYEKETHLTVMKTSLFFAGDGFTVYDTNAQIVFRVDSYGPDAHDAGELVLMDPSGRCVLTVRRKRPSLHQRWEGFLGERKEGEKPIFSAKRSSMIGRSNVTVEVFGGRTEEYVIEGSFGHRNCTIYDSEKETMAEMRRKVDSSTNMKLGKDVFWLTLKAGFDAAFAMGLVLVLDQTNDDNGGDGDVDQRRH